MRLTLFRVIAKHCCIIRHDRYETCGLQKVARNENLGIFTLHMSSANITVQPTPLEGHAHLVLFEKQPDSFYLEIPLCVIRDVCRHPPKYLRYLGWCILGVEGSLQDGQGHEVNLNHGLVDRGIYHYYRLPAGQQGCHLHFFVILKLTIPQLTSLTLLTLRSSSCAATYQLKQEPG